MIVREAKVSDATGIALVYVESWRTTYKNILPSNFLMNLSYKRREAMFYKFKKGICCIKLLEFVLITRWEIYMRVLLELIRIIIMFAIVGSALGYLLENIYLEMGIHPEKLGSIGFIAIFVLFFVLYRNKLQFSGWYKGKG